MCGHCFHVTCRRMTRMWVSLTPSSRSRRPWIHQTTPSSVRARTEHSRYTPHQSHSLLSMREGVTYPYMCPSLTFWVQFLILAILRIWYRLKGLCLKISFLKTEQKYSYYLCQYHHFEVKALIIMNCVHVKKKGDTFLSIQLGLIKWDNFARIWYIYITCKEFCHWKAFYSFCGPVKIVFKT